MKPLLLLMFIVNNALGASQVDYFDLTLEELLNIEVSVASHDKKEQSLLDTAGIISTYEAKDLEGFGLHSLSDMLSFVPGVNVTYSIFGHVQYSIRGIYTVSNQKVLFLLNGVPYFSPSHGDHPHFSLPFAAISKIEVIRGPGALVYGSNASAGVINVVTKKNKSSVVKFYQGTNPHSNISSYYNKTLSDDHYYSVSLKFEQDEGHDPESRAYNPPASFPSDTGTVANVNRSRDIKSLLLNYNYKNTNFMSHIFESTFSGLAGAATVINKTDMTQQGNLSHLDHTFKYDKMSVQLFGTYINFYRSARHERGITTAGSSLTTHEDNGNKNYRTKAGIKLNYNVLENLEFFGGIEYETRSIGKGYEEDSNGNEVFVFNPHATSVEKSVYAQVDYTYKQATIIQGFRYTENSGAGEEISPRTSFLYKLNEESSLKLMYSEGFNSPTFTQTILGWPGIVEPAPDLTAEKIKVFDLAYSYAHNNNLLVINYYNFKTEDFIIRRSISTESALPTKNFSEEFFSRSGIEIDFQKKSTNVTWFSSFTYNTDGNSNNDRLSVMVPKFIVNTGLTLKLKEVHTLGGSIRHISKRSSYSSHHLFNMNYNYKLNSGLDLFAVIRNALDEEIQSPDYLSLNPEIKIPSYYERSLLVGFKFKF